MKNELMVFLKGLAAIIPLAILITFAVITSWGVWIFLGLCFIGICYALGVLIEELSRQRKR